MQKISWVRNELSNIAFHIYFCCCYFRTNPKGVTYFETKRNLKTQTELLADILTLVDEVTRLLPVQKISSKSTSPINVALLQTRKKF